MHKQSIIDKEYKNAWEQVKIASEMIIKSKEAFDQAVLKLEAYKQDRESAKGD